MTDQPRITLLGVSSPNVVKVAIMLEELALPYDLRFVAVFKGEQFTPEFLALNPLGKVPVLLDPKLGQPLAESGAILFWLAEREGRLLPTTGPARYEVMQWLMVQMSAIGPMLGQFTHFRLLPPGGEPYAYGRYEGIAKRLYSLIDQRVSDRAFIAGDDYSIADIATLPWAEYIERHGFGWDEYPAMKRWCERLAARPAVVRAKERVYGEFTAPSTETIQSATPQDLERFFSRTAAMPEADFSAVKRMS